MFRDRPSLRGDIFFFFWFGVTRRSHRSSAFATDSTAYVRYSSAFDYTPIFRAFLIDIAFPASYIAETINNRYTAENTKKLKVEDD